MPSSPEKPLIASRANRPRQSQMVRRLLDRLGVSYEYVDLDTSPAAAARLRWLTGGSASHPTVYVGGELLVEPTLRELEWALVRSGPR